MSKTKAPPAPKQKRAEETREKIIEAATMLFQEQGYHATSSKKIAKAAGVAVGSFYNHFTDKKSLLFEIHRRHAKAVHAKIEEAITRMLNGEITDGRELTRAIVEQTLDMHSFSPDLHRELTALAYTDSDFAAMMRKEEKEAVAVMLKLLERQREALRVEDLEAAAWVISQSVEAVIHGIKIFGPPIKAKRLTDALGDMIYRLMYAEPL